jgi:hypothetical protein
LLFQHYKCPIFFIQYYDIFSISQYKRQLTYESKGCILNVNIAVGNDDKYTFPRKVECRWANNRVECRWANNRLLTISGCSFIFMSDYSFAKSITICGSAKPTDDMSLHEQLNLLNCSVSALRINRSSSSSKRHDQNFYRLITYTIVVYVCHSSE